MATVCVNQNDFFTDGNGRLVIKKGCGIQGSVDGIRVNTQAWPFDCDINATNAQGVYCDADGEIYSDAKHFPLSKSISDEIQTGIPGSTPYTSPILTLDATNPSNCRTMFTSVILANFTTLFVPNGSFPKVIMDVDIDTGLFTPYEMWDHDISDQGGIFDEHDSRWSEKTFLMQIDPGQTRTVRLRMRVTNLAANTTTIAAMQNEIRIIGGTA